MLARILEAVCFTFAAWMATGFLVYAGYSWLGRVWQTLLRCGGVLLIFIPVFRIYFRRPRPLPPAAATGVAVGFIVLLDLFFISPYFLHPYDVFLKFWDWQLPALLAAASVYGVGRVAKS